MQKAFYFAYFLLLASSVLARKESEKKIIRQDLYDEVSQKAKLWKPASIDNHKFRDVSVDQFRSRLGALDVEKNHKPNPLFKAMSKVASYLKEESEEPLQIISNWKKSVKDYLGLEFEPAKYLPKSHLQAEPIPRFFDAREAWPDCIHPPVLQWECGACWAFAASELLADRLCIHSDGEIDLILSPQDMINCDFYNYGCDGGYLINSVDFLLNEGVVSEECLPYEDKTNSCTDSCTNPEIPYEKFYCEPGTLAMGVNRDDIQRELMTNGPMMVGLVVFEDFLYYESGVYEYTAGEFAGGHAMKLVGWGTQHDYDGEEFVYWICQNEWGEEWGDDGFISIREGEIGIDSLVIACMPEF